MNWEQRYRLKLAAHTSLVPWASVSLAGALIVAVCVRAIDRETGWKLFGFSPDGARAVLGALAGSMLTFIVFVLSATLIVVQLASGQLTPRVISLVFAMPWVRVTLGVFTFSYTYTLSALGRVESKVPDLHVGVAVVLNLLCIVVFFVFVQRLSRGLRPSAMLTLVAERGRAVIAHVYPNEYDPSRLDQSDNSTPHSTPHRLVDTANRSGVIMAVGAERLARIAQEADALIELIPQVGDFVAPEHHLFRVYGGSRPIPAGALRACVAVGEERTLEQDPRFAFRILVDIANRALSPAVNDPTTAVLALDQIDGLLDCLGRRRLDEGVVRDAGGRVRLIYRTPNWPDFVTLAVSEIRHFGEGSIQIDRRLTAMLEHLLKELPADRRPALEEELGLLKLAVHHGFRDEVDRRRARVGDLQGVGGSKP